MIGRTVEIARSRNPSATGIQGKVIDETRHTITIATTKGSKTIIKDQIEEIK